MHDRTFRCVLVENRNGPGCYLVGAWTTISSR